MGRSPGIFWEAVRRRLAAVGLVPLKPLDGVAFGLGIAAVVVLTVIVVGDSAQPTMVRIRAEESEFTYPADQPRQLSFDGPIGTTRVQIDDGGVQVLSDPGRQQICVRQGRIDEAGQWLACLPNRVFIRLQGDPEEARVDGQTY
jgi:hypothetical protein